MFLQQSVGGGLNVQLPQGGTAVLGAGAQAGMLTIQSGQQSVSSSEQVAGAGQHTTLAQHQQLQQQQQQAAAPQQQALQSSTLSQVRHTPVPYSHTHSHSEVMWRKVDVILLLLLLLSLRGHASFVRKDYWALAIICSVKAGVYEREMWGKGHPLIQHLFLTVKSSILIQGPDLKGFFCGFKAKLKWLKKEFPAVLYTSGLFLFMFCSLSLVELCNVLF